MTDKPYPGPTCPTCRKTAPRTNTRYGERYDCCGLTAWGDKPLASPGTLKARVAAHAAFDPIWKDGHLSRTQAYKRLAMHLGLPRGQVHMSLMDEATALRVPAAAAVILAELRPPEPGYQASLPPGVEAVDDAAMHEAPAPGM